MTQSRPVHARRQQDIEPTLPPRRVAVVGQDTRGQGAMVGADAHGPAQGLALVHQGREDLRARIT